MLPVSSPREIPYRPPARARDHQCPARAASRKPMEQRCPVSLIPCGAPSSRQRRASSFTNARTSGASLDAAWARQREGHSPSQRQHAESREHHFSHEPLRGREIFRAGGSLCTQKRQSKNVSRETFRPQGLLCIVLVFNGMEICMIDSRPSTLLEVSPLR